MQVYVKVRRHTTNPHSWLFEGAKFYVQEQDASALERAVIACLGGLPLGDVGTVRAQVSASIVSVEHD